MRNTFKEFHFGTFTETFLDFCKKVLLPILMIIGLLVWASFESKAYAKEKVVPNEFCFDITPVKKGILINEKKALGCFKQNEPPPKTKSYCRPENWYYVSLGVLQCINKSGDGYRLERKYPI